jgi:spore coat polysaccharide biosynthesis protein SpsF (cytidylyltransferase family)
MNLLTTVFCVFGFMTVIFLRMRRIYKVYSLYDAYILDQKNDLDVDREEDYKLISSITTSLNSSTALSVSSGRRETDKIKQ